MKPLNVVLGTVMLLLSSCVVVGEWTGAPDDPPVVVLGDSLVFQSEIDGNDAQSPNRFITDELVSNGFQAWVTGLFGGRVDTVYPNMWNDPSRQGVVPDILVVALGTNDMRLVDGQTQADVEDARLLIRAWLAEVPDTCVRFIGVAENIWGWGLDVTAPAWNAMLAEEAALHADAEYVPWSPLPAWTQGGASPHMNQAGRTSYRAVIVNAALDCAA